jgi:uncharacterized protein YdaU (DUF1376 family)
MAPFDMKKQQPYLPLYVGDFWASVADWEADEALLYLGLLTHQWSLGSLPTEKKKLCILMRLDRAEFDRRWPQVSTKFIVRNGRLINERLEDHRNKAIEKSKKNAESGQKGGKAKAHNAASESLANANANAIANATKALEQLRGENEANGRANAKDSLYHPNPNQSKPSLRVLSKEESLG